MRLPAVSLLLMLPTLGDRAWADGGLVRLSEQHGRYRITVFTTPTPVRAGWVDVSVFVQDAATGAPVSDVEVTMDVAPADRPEQSTHYRATREAATNKLFRAARFELVHAGKWEVAVAIDGPWGKVETRFEAEAAGPLPSVSALVWWIGWPIIPVLLFAVHQCLVRRRRFSTRPSQ